jgi:hypothetical protein
MPRDNHYYDSARAKVDKTDFASSQMPLNMPRRAAPSGGSGRVFRWLVWGLVLAVVLAVAKRYIF